MARVIPFNGSRAPEPPRPTWGERAGGCLACVFVACCVLIAVLFPVALVLALVTWIKGMLGW